MKTAVDYAKVQQYNEAIIKGISHLRLTDLLKSDDTGEVQVPKAKL